VLAQPSVTPPARKLSHAPENFSWIRRRELIPLFLPGGEEHPSREREFLRGGKKKKKKKKNGKGSKEERRSPGTGRVRRRSCDIAPLTLAFPFARERNVKSVAGK